MPLTVTPRHLLFMVKSQAPSSIPTDPLELNYVSHYSQDSTGYAAAQADGDTQLAADAAASNKQNGPAHIAYVVLTGSMLL